MEREEETKQLIMDFGGTFGTPEGIRVLLNLSKKCREHTATYVDGNPHATAYKEGMRSVIIYIREWLSKDPNIKKQTKVISKEN